MRVVRWLYTLPLWLRAVVRRDHRDADVDEELRFHVERQTEAFAAAGMSPDDARRAARRAIGGLLQQREASRDVRGISVADDLQQDFRYAARTLRRSRAFTTVGVLSLALGIGASTAVFSVVDGVLLRKLPVAEPGRLVTLREYIAPGRTNDFLTHEEYGRLRDETRVFASVATVNAFDRANVALSGAGGGTDAGRARVAIVSGSYFGTFGVNAALGRVLTPSDDRVLGGHPVVVISDAYWERRLARAPDVLERTLALNGTTYQIVGVAPPGFAGDWVGRPTDIWIPFMMHQQVIIELPQHLMHRNDSWLRVVARLAPGVSIERASVEVETVHRRILREWWGPTLTPEETRDIAQRRLVAEPDARGYSVQRESFAKSLAILALVVGLVLGVACANVASLLLARAAARDREMAVRLALGAGRGRLVRQLLTESIVLAMAGGALGILVAIWGTRAMTQSLAAGPVEMFWGRSTWVAFDAHVDVRALSFTLAVCLVTGCLFGLAPALRGAGITLASTLTGRGAASDDTAARFPIGKALVVAQVALSLVVLIAAGLFTRSLRNLRSQELGFERNRVLLVWTQPSATGRSPLGLRELYHQVRQRLSALPGVVGAAAANGGMLNGTIVSPGPAYNPMQVVGLPPKPTTTPSWRTFVTPGFFAATGIPLLAGRDFTEQDTDSMPRVVIINRSMARHFFGDGNAVGHRARFSSDSGTTTEIVGVVGDIVEGTPRAAGQRALRTYFPYRDRDSGRRLAIMQVAVRTTGDPKSIAPLVRAELAAIDASLPVLRMDTVDEQLDDVLAQDRLVAGLATFFAALVALLASLGLYGVIAYTTARRTGEIGVRMALGATGGALRRMVLRQALTLVLLGIAIGIPLTLVASRLVEAYLFGVAAWDPATIAGATLLMVVVAAVAAFVPAHRASRVDPMVALRCD